MSSLASLFSELRGSSSSAPLTTESHSLLPSWEAETAVAVVEPSIGLASLPSVLINVVVQYAACEDDNFLSSILNGRVTRASLPPSIQSLVFRIWNSVTSLNLLVCPALQTNDIGTICRLFANVNHFTAQIVDATDDALQTFVHYRNLQKLHLEEGTNITFAGVLKLIKTHPGLVKVEINGTKQACAMPVLLRCRVTYNQSSACVKGKRKLGSSRTCLQRAPYDPNKAVLIQVMKQRPALSIILNTVSLRPAHAVRAFEDEKKSG